MDKKTGEHTTLGELSDRNMEKLFKDKAFLSKFEKQGSNSSGTGGQGQGFGDNKDGGQKDGAKGSKSKHFRF